MSQDNKEDVIKSEKDGQKAFLELLNFVDRELDQAKEFLKASPHKALDSDKKGDFKQAQELLGEFSTTFEKMKRGYEIELKKSTLNSKSKNGIGVFISDVLGGFNKKLKGLVDNPICTAVGGVIKSACDVVLTELKTHLGSSVALGKFAKSIVDLGKTVVVVATMQKDTKSKEHVPARGHAEMPKFFNALDDVKDALDSARILLYAEIPKGVSDKVKKDLSRSQETLKTFEKAVDIVQKDAKEIKLSDPLINLAKSPEFRGKVESVLKVPLDLAKKVFPSRICKATANVIVAGCDIILVQVKGQLATVKATGTLAASIENLGTAVRSTVVGKSVVANKGMSR